MTAQFDIGLQGRKIIEAKRREQGEAPNRPSNPINVSTFFSQERKVVKGTPIARDMWRTVDELQDLLGDPLGIYFRKATAIFIREGRVRPYGEQAVLEYNPDIVKEDDSQVGSIRVKFHLSLRYQKRTRDDVEDPNTVEIDIVRYVPNWQGLKGYGRYNWVWVQEFESSEPSRAKARTEPRVESAGIAFKGRLPIQIRFIVLIEDYNASQVADQTLDEVMSGKKGCYITSRPVYTSVFIKLYRPKTYRGLADPVYGITEILQIPVAPQRGLLRGRRIYPLTSIYHSIYVVPKDKL